MFLLTDSKTWQLFKPLSTFTTAIVSRFIFGTKIDDGPERKDDFHITVVVFYTHPPDMNLSNKKTHPPVYTGND